MKYGAALGVPCDMQMKSISLDFRFRQKIYMSDSLCVVPFEQTKRTVILR